MTFLPIIDRELRVAARKRSTFRLRVASALVGMVIGGAIMMLSRIGAFGPSTMGDALFGVLTWLALLVALTAGLFFTADCLSEEKREGTLGFLFLTDLRGYDVAGGKLFATSLRVTFALMSIIPILAVTFVMGAVSGPVLEDGPGAAQCLVLLALRRAHGLGPQPRCAEGARRDRPAAVVARAGRAGRRRHLRPPSARRLSRPC